MANDNPWHKWYTRFPWTGDSGLRYKTLARDPVCAICNRNPSTIADHKIPHKGNWSLFVDFNNTMGVCKPCHDHKTATEDGGFGNPKRTGDDVVTTGDEGKQFTSTSLRAEDFDAALNRED